MFTQIERHRVVTEIIVQDEVGNSCPKGFLILHLERLKDGRWSDSVPYFDEDTFQVLQDLELVHHVRSSEFTGWCATPSSIERASNFLTELQGSNNYL